MLRHCNQEEKMNGLNTGVGLTLKTGVLYHCKFSIFEFWTDGRTKCFSLFY